jgi:hypothetical protein
MTKMSSTCETVGKKTVERNTGRKYTEPHRLAIKRGLVGKKSKNPKLTSERLSVALRGRVPWNKGMVGNYILHKSRGRKLTEEQKKEISEKTKAAMQREEVKIKHLGAMELRKGKPHSKETKLKISNTMKRKGLNPQKWRKK